MDCEVLKFYSLKRREEGGMHRVLAELVTSLAVRVEAGRMQHKRRVEADPWADVDGALMPVQRPFVTATFLKAPEFAAARSDLAERMEELGFACLLDHRRAIPQWAPLRVGDGFAPLGFFAKNDGRGSPDEVSGRLALLMKFLRVRTELALRRVPGGWHVTTYHQSDECAKEFRKNMERQAPGLLEFDRQPEPLPERVEFLLAGLPPMGPNTDLAVSARVLTILRAMRNRAEREPIDAATMEQIIEAAMRARRLFTVELDGGRTSIRQHPAPPSGPGLKH